MNHRLSFLWHSKSNEAGVMCDHSDERAFSNLPKLNELQISGCRKLQFIHAGAFEDTPMLRVLDLSGNGLHTVTDLWNTLPRLELIKLEHVSTGSYT